MTDPSHCRRQGRPLHNQPPKYWVPGYQDWLSLEELMYAKIADQKTDCDQPRFVHDPEHRDRPGEPRCQPKQVPDTLLDFLRALPRDVLVKTCNSIGHPSFWLGPGYRYICVCGEITYHD